MEKAIVGVCAGILFLAFVKPNRFSMPLALVASLLTLILRTVKLGYPSFFAPFDSILLFLSLFLLSALISKQEGRFTYFFGLVLSLFLLFVSDKAEEIPPIVRTPLFIIHVGTAMVSYGLITSLGILGIENFFKKNNLERTKTALKLAFLFFSVSMIAGGVWAFLAWGDIFPLGPKSVFSLSLWLYAAFSLHVYKDETLSKNLNLFLILGLILVLFNFLGVNYLFGGTHAF